MLVECFSKLLKKSAYSPKRNKNIQKICAPCQPLIKKNVKVNSILIDNGWLEFDTINDYELYSNMLNENKISQLIKLNY